jgi:ABC-2 type transport system permease protein
MQAMIRKEFRQLRRDRRTLALMIVVPLLLLVVFGYVARFDVKEIPTAVVGAQAETVAGMLEQMAGDRLDVRLVDPAGDRAAAEDLLRRSRVIIAIVAEEPPFPFLVDGSELFAAQSARVTTSGLTTLPAGTFDVEVLFNPELSTAAIMVPALIGMVLTAVGTVITSLGVVRERQEGTLEQLAVMPLRPRDVIVGKIAPYFLVGIIDMTVITAAGLWLFDVPFRGSWPVFITGALLFLLAVLGLGVLISTLSQTQGEAIQLAIMTMLPQVMLSGMIFPLTSMPWGVRWISYLLPLTYFIQIVRGVFLKATPIDALGVPFLALTALAVVVLGLAVLRFRRDLTPSGRRRDDTAAEAAS